MNKSINKILLFLIFIIFSISYTVGKVQITPLNIQCLKVQDTSFSTYIFDKNNINDQLTCKQSKYSGGLLYGTGDILIIVNTEEYNKIQKELGEPILVLNGVALSQDAKLIALNLMNEDTLLLRYKIENGAETKKLWSMLYASGHLYTYEPLYVSLGWKGNASESINSQTVRQSFNSKIQISSDIRLFLSIFLLVIIVFGILYLGLKSDAMRDSSDKKIPSWWHDAKLLQLKLKGLKEEINKQAEIIKYDPSYQQDLRESYNNSAKEALAGLEIQDEDIKKTVIGLALRKDSWHPVRASFSLNRTQFALWFTFATCTGIFLWLLYGDLQPISGSLLILLGISASTTGVVGFSDSGLEEKPYSPSKGFWTDVTTGFDEKIKVYRYQAVCVNILLVVVGIDYIFQKLEYPQFDGTWLIFLGLSSLTYGLGRKITES